MAVYVIVDIDVKDPEMYESYKQLTPASIAQFGGRFLVRGGDVVVMEGDWSPKRLVVAEFPDMDTARAWWSSDDYSTARKIRLASAETNMIFAQGV